MADDRDKRKPLTPPSGILAQIAQAPSRRRHDEFEDEYTPIGAPPTESRARLGDIQSMKAEIAARIDLHAADDLRQLGEIKSEIREVRSDNRATTSTLSDLKVSNAKQTVILDVLADEAKLSREKKVKLEAAKLAAEIDDYTDARKKLRGFKWWAVRAVLGAAIGAVPTLMTLAIEHC